MFKIWGSKGTAIIVPLNFHPQLSDGNANVIRRHPMPMPNMFFVNFRPIFLCFAKPSPKFPTSSRCFCATNTATSCPNPKEEQVEEEDVVLPKKTPPKRKKKSTTSSAANIKQLLIRSEAAQMKLNWLSSLNNNNSHPSDDDDHVGHTTNNDSSASQWVIGIDPDVSGALALLKPLDSGFSPQVFDSPHLKVLVGKRARRRLDPKAIIQLLQSFDAPSGTIAYLEQSLPYPGDGKQGWWSGGFNYGIWIGVLVALGFSVVPVPSLLWKNQFKLAGNGSSKDDSREAACTLFPSIRSQLTRKKDHGRAEALLIAAYGKGLKLSSESCLVSEELMASNLES